MNKTFLIAGGTAVVSLAVGTAGGYFIAKKRFDQQIREEVTREVNATKKYYSVLLMQAKEQKPDSPEDLRENVNDDEVGEDLEDESDPEEEELTLKEQMDLAKGREKLLERQAVRAFVDYNKVSTEKVAAGKVPIQRNVFDDASASDDKPKKSGRLRNPDGSFRKKTVREEEHDPPQIIDAETFLLNDSDHNQESLLYFRNDKMLVLEADAHEQVDINLVGEVNLTLFPDVPPDMISMIYVENTGLSTNYEIKLMTESLTAYLGLGENGGGEELDNATWV